MKKQTSKRAIIRDSRRCRIVLCSFCSTSSEYLSTGVSTSSKYLLVLLSQGSTSRTWRRISGESSRPALVLKLQVVLSVKLVILPFGTLGFTLSEPFLQGGERGRLPRKSSRNRIDEPWMVSPFGLKISIQSMHRSSSRTSPA